MLVHVVLLKFRPDAPAEHVDALVGLLRELPEAVGTIRKYTVSRDAGMAADNAEISVVAEFDDVAGYETYRDHPVHRRIITEQILPLLETRLATQYLT